MAKKIQCPSYLDDVAKKEWKRILKVIESENIEFNAKDLKVLEGYCTNYSNWLMFEEKAKEAGYLIFSPNGYPQQHPYCQLAKNAQTQYLNFMKELGLTPASRARINKNKNISTTDGYSEEDKEMEVMFND
ncbi:MULTISPECIES: phage terminase small subunit P27 family [Clostridium]|uniref:Phage terminase, small subunit, P27 family n=1 Tax=Clostridium disporicum TaxID=84024 RepID=A0A174AHW6_9CLOT|nr:MULTISPECIES: phage terminase small subunit P27 family [Clostridium]CUN87270.1 phage terminase%2C small subunit%2C %2C P27 family [Clostridium disporicum]